jgi:mRNA export factor
MLVTGLWDKTVKYWDSHQAQLVATLQSRKEFTHSMGRISCWLLAERIDTSMSSTSMNNEPTKFYKTLQCPLKWQTRVVSCFTDASGVGSWKCRG